MMFTIVCVTILLTENHACDDYSEYGVEWHHCSPVTAIHCGHLQHSGGGRRRQQRQVPGWLWISNLSSGLSAISCQSAVVSSLPESVGILRDDLGKGTVVSDYVNDRAALWPVQQPVCLDSSLLRDRRSPCSSHHRLPRLDPPPSRVDRQWNDHDWRWTSNLHSPTLCSSSVSFHGVKRLEQPVCGNSVERVE